MADEGRRDPSAHHDTLSEQVKQADMNADHREPQKKLDMDGEEPHAHSQPDLQDEGSDLSLQECSGGLLEPVADAQLPEEHGRAQQELNDHQHVQPVCQLEVEV